MAIELAKAYVQIVPSAQGIRGALTDVIEPEAESAGASGGKKAATGFGKALGAAGKLTGMALGAAAAGVGALAKEAVAAYADFEQLEGGIKTLFGADAQAVMENASRAFQSAGLSANDYMEASIQSAAAMINSLDGDTARASQLMDMSITDMADNVNKMGTSMEAVQNAYRGFSRGNFTMLDNLALGFAGTREGMQQLLDKASELSGIEYDISSYSDIVEAIHVVQDEMGITGTTAKEAAGTISGSLASLKGAWQNLLTGIASGEADIGRLAGDVVTGARNVLMNTIPQLKNVLPALVQVVREVIPALVEEIVPLASSLLPDLIDGSIELALAVGQALIDNAPEIIRMVLSAVASNLPKLVEGGVQLAMSLVSGLIFALPELAQAGLQLLGGLLEAVFGGVARLAEAGAQLVAGLWNGISGAADWLWQQVSGWLSNLWGGILDFFGIHSPSTKGEWAGEMLGVGLAGGITDSASEAVDAAAEMSAGVMGALTSGSDYSLTATGASTLEIHHSGSIRVEGVNSRQELVGVTDIIYDQIVARLQREVRYA